MTTKTTKWIIAGVALAILAGLIPVLAPRLMLGALAIPTMMALAVVTIILIIGVISNAQEKRVSEKRKRGLDSQDIYSVIDRLVDDLDEDEVAYLGERLAEREQSHGRERTHSLEAEVDERPEARGAKQS